MKRRHSRDSMLGARATAFSRRCFGKGAASGAVRRASAQRVLPILYGSQTGTAKAFAKMLSREGRRNERLKSLGVTMKPVSMQDATPAGVAGEDVAIFIAASYGEGEPTDNAKSFFQALQECPISFEKSKVAVCARGRRGLAGSA